MKTSSILCLSALLISLADLAGAQAPNPDTTAIKSLLQEYAHACQEEDLVALGDLFVRGPDTVMITAVGSQITTGWKSIQEAYRTFFQNVEDCKMDFAIHSIKVLADGRSACLTARQEATMQINGRLVTFRDVRMVWVLEKLDGKWRIVNAHWSSPAGS